MATVIVENTVAAISAIIIGYAYENLVSKQRKKPAVWDKRWIAERENKCGRQCPCHGAIVIFSCECS